MSRSAGNNTRREMKVIDETVIWKRRVVYDVEEEKRSPDDLRPRLSLVLGTKVLVGCS
jgi:hypothetical protein